MIPGRTPPRGRPGRRRAPAVVATALAALCTALAAPAYAAPTAALDARLQAASPTERIPVIATLRSQVDGESYAGRPEALMRALRRTADATQPSVTDDITGRVRAFWLVNAVAFTGTPDEVRAVAADPAVASVDLDAPVRVADAAGGTGGAVPFPDPGPGDWGLGAIHAPAEWSTYGFTGAGVRVGVIDTGVDPAAPDLRGKIAAWHDFVSGSATPIDDNGHGTHTAGTLAGGSAGGAPIGVAPGARLVVARAMGASGVGPGSALLAAAEWMTDPDGDPATPDQPQVVSNSWSASTANDTWFRPMIRRWLDLGIVPVFAAGNTGPAAGSVGSPAGYPEAIAVGALDSDGSVPSFSARGPVVWQDADGLGSPAAGTVLAKPDLAAPGVGITSSVGTGYLTYSGTSMAAPHVAGVAALVRQADPALGPTQVADLLRATAVDVGPPGVDPASGYGRVDALRAVAAAVGPAPDTRFTVTPPRATNAVAPSWSVALSGGGTAVRTRVDGGAWSAPGTTTTFSLRLPEGRHVVEAQALDAAGAVDPTPARSVVTIDRTRPRVRIALARHGVRATFRSRVTDRGGSGARAGTVRWSFGGGETARGAVVSRIFPEARTRRVIVTARDAAGNVSYAAVSFRPRAATAVRSLRVAGRASRRTRDIAVSGRLVRAARLRATLRPVLPSASATARGLAASFAPQELGPTVARTTAIVRRPARFRLALRVRDLAPGVYRLDLRAAEGHSSVGRLRISRRVVVR